MRAWPEVAVWWAVLVLVWLATLNSFSSAELVVSAVAAVPCALAARYARRAARVRWSPSPGLPRLLLRGPWALVHDTAAVLRLAVSPRTPGVDQVDQVDGPRFADVAQQAGWEAAATIAMSVTPGSVVIDAHEGHDTLVVHTVPGQDTGLRRAAER